MIKAIRTARVVVISLFAAVFLAFGTITANAGTVLIMGGIAAGELPDFIMSNLFAGKYRNETRVNVTWPAQARPYTGDTGLTLGESITVGVGNLANAIGSRLGSLKPGETLTVVGLSAGSLVVDELLRQLATNPNAPAKGQLTFVLAADPTRQATITGQQPNSQLGYTFQPPPVTKYNIVVVTQEYDGNADFPDRVFNLTAVFNAMIGSVLLHNSTFFADLSTVPGKNIKTTTNALGGTTSSYLIPTAQLPLVTLMPWLAPQEAALKAIVDSGYSRNDIPAVTAVARTALAAPAAVVPVPAAAAVAEAAPAVEAKVTTPATESKVPAESTVPVEPVKAVAAEVEAPPASEPAASDTIANVVDESTTPATSVADTGKDADAEAKVSKKVTKSTDGSAPSTSVEPKAAKSAKSGDGVDALSKRQIAVKKETSSTGEAAAKDTTAGSDAKSAPSAASPSGEGAKSTP